MRRLLSVLLLALVPQAAFAEPVVTSFELENGMQGVVIEDHRAPVVTHMVWYKVGSADETAGKTGIAHYLEHLLFKGTEKIPSGRFSEIVAENGGQENAFTSRDYTGYFQNIASDRLGLMMSMEADRMRNLTIGDDDWQAERDVVGEERRSRTDNVPSAKFREQFTSALYLSHPYGTPVIGWKKEVEALTKEDALEFYARFYAPNNAILVVAGDVDPAEVEALAKEHYGVIDRIELPEHVRSVEPPHLAERRLTMTDPRVAQSQFMRGYLAPSYLTAEPGEAEGLVLLADILGGGTTRRLQRLMTQSTDMAIYAGAYYSGLARDHGEFVVYAGPKGDTSLSAIEGAMDWMLEDLLKNGVTDKEVARSKKSLIADEIYSQDSQRSLARQYGAALTVGLTVEDIQSWRGKLEAATAEDVMDAARKVLNRKRSVTGILKGPDAKKEAAE